jgi:hypothetical protein
MYENWTSECFYSVTVSVMALTSESADDEWHFDSYDIAMM